MKISVVGAGNAGSAIALDLSIKGHSVSLIKTSRAMHDDNYNYLINNNNEMRMCEFGEMKSGRLSNVTRSFEDITDSDVVIILTQTTYHERVIEKIAPYLRDNQLLLINPGYLSTAYVLKHCGKKRIIVAEAQSSFIDGRIVEPGLFKVGFRNVRNPIGIFPNRRRKEAISLLDKLDQNIVYLDSVVEAALHNPNLVVHTVGSILSIPRIEKAKDDFCLYHEAYTRENAATWRVVEALDEEKMAVLKKLGLSAISYVEACKYRNSLDESIDAREVFFDYAEMETRAKGPESVDSRYITEDVPQGLVLLESVAKSLKIRTPITTALIEISSASLGKNLREDGRTVLRLGEDNIKSILEDGRKHD